MCHPTCQCDSCLNTYRSSNSYSTVRHNASSDGFQLYRPHNVNRICGTLIHLAKEKRFLQWKIQKGEMYVCMHSHAYVGESASVNRKEKSCLSRPCGTRDWDIKMLSIDCRYSVVCELVTNATECLSCAHNVGNHWSPWVSILLYLHESSEHPFRDFLGPKNCVRIRIYGTLDAHAKSETSISLLVRSL